MNQNTAAKSIAIIVIATCFLYGFFINNPIIFDDIPFFLIDKLGNQPVSENHFSLIQIRSLPYATLAWTKTWFGLELIYFRIGNLLLHITTCIALWALMSVLFKVTQNTGDKTPKFTHAYATLPPALLFALHPVSTYAAGYLVQRTILMATLFGILAMWSYVCGSQNGNPTKLWLTVPFYYLAVFSKEHAVTLIIIFPILTILIHEDWKIKLKQRLGVFVACLLIAILAILARKGILGAVYEVNGVELLGDNTELAYPLSVLTQSVLYFKYILIWILPNPEWMSIDMREPLAHSFASYYLLGALGYLVWGLVGFWLLFQRSSEGILGFAMLYPWLMFLTEFSTVRVQEPFVLYRSYIWAVGGICAVPVFIGRLKPRSAVAIVTLGILMYLPISMDRLVTLSHPLLVWDDAEKLVADHKDLPGASRIYYNRGTEYLNIDFHRKAIIDLQQAVTLSPKFVEAYGNLAATYMKTQDWQNAAKAFTKAIDITNENGTRNPARYYQGRAEALALVGDLAASQLDYRESCRLGNRGCEKVH